MKQTWESQPGGALEGGAIAETYAPTASKQPVEERTFKDLAEDLHRCVLVEFAGLNLFGLYSAQRKMRQPLLTSPPGTEFRVCPPGGIWYQ